MTDPKDDDDVYNQSVLRQVALLVTEAEADAEAGWEQLARVTHMHARLRSALVSAQLHLRGECLCDTPENCRARTLDIVSTALFAER